MNNEMNNSRNPEWAANIQIWKEKCRERGINKSENSTYPLNRLILQGVWIIFGSWCWGHTGNSAKKDNEFKKSTKSYAISNILQLSTNRRRLDRPRFPHRNETHEGPATAQLMGKSSSIDLDYCDIEWFALEINRDHSAVFEIAPKYCVSDSCWL